MISNGFISKLLNDFACEKYKDVCLALETMHFHYVNEFWANAKKIPNYENLRNKYTQIAVETRRELGLNAKRTIIGKTIVAYEDDTDGVVQLKMDDGSEYIFDLILATNREDSYVHFYPKEQ